MDEYHQYAGVAQTIGVDVKFLTPDQVKEIKSVNEKDAFPANKPRYSYWSKEK